MDRLFFPCADPTMHAASFDPAGTGDFAHRVLLGQSPAAGLALDAEGWAEVPYLLRALKAAGHLLSRFEFERLVSTDPAGRFALTADRRRIRAIPPPAAAAAA